MEFPFVDLSMPEIAFCQVPNYDEVLEKCPSEGVVGNWENAARALHLNGGWTEERQQDACDLFCTEDVEEAKAQLAYLNAWLGNFTPSHQEKMRVGGWLLSLMFTKCPSW